MKKETTIEIFRNLSNDGLEFYTLKQDGCFWKKYFEGNSEIMKLKNLKQVYEVLNIIMAETNKKSRAKDFSKVNIIHHKKLFLETQPQI